MTYLFRYVGDELLECAGYRFGADVAVAFTVFGTDVFVAVGSHVAGVALAQAFLVEGGGGQEGVARRCGLGLSSKAVLVFDFVCAIHVGVFWADVQDQRALEVISMAGYVARKRLGRFRIDGMSVEQIYDLHAKVLGDTSGGQSVGLHVRAVRVDDGESSNAVGHQRATVVKQDVDLCFNTQGHAAGEVQMLRRVAHGQRGCNDHLGVQPLGRLDRHVLGDGGVDLQWQVWSMRFVAAGGDSGQLDLVKDGFDFSERHAGQKNFGHPVMIVELPYVSKCSPAKFLTHISLRLILNTVFHEQFKEGWIFGEEAPVFAGDITDTIIANADME